MAVHGSGGRDQPDVPRVIRRTAVLATHLAAILLQVAALAIVVNAVYRYTIGGGFAIVSELGRFTLMWMVFLALAGTHLAGGHVRVELLVSRLGPRAGAILTNWVVPLASLGFLGLILRASWHATLTMVARGTQLPSNPPLPMWPLMAVVPFGTTLLMVVIVSGLLRRLTASRTGGPAE